MSYYDKKSTDFYRFYTTELTMLKTCVYPLIILLCVGIFIGCGEAPVPELEIVTPPRGSTIDSTTSIFLTFDQIPFDLQIIGTTFNTVGEWSESDNGFPCYLPGSGEIEEFTLVILHYRNTVEVRGAFGVFPAGRLDLDVSWADRSTTVFRTYAKP